MEKTKPKPKVGYILKMYPRFSETFIVSEMLALEARGLDLEIFSLRAPVDGRFHATLSKVQGQVRYISSYPLKASDLWSLIHQEAASLPNIWSTLQTLGDEDARNVYQAIQIAGIARQSGINHFHAHFASVATDVARIAAKLLGISYSFTTHAKDIFHESVDYSRLKRSAAEASHVIAISKYNKDFLIDQIGIEAGKVQHVYNGLDLQTYHYISQQQTTFQAAAVGRLVEKKGFDVLLQAWHIIKSQGINLQLKLIGAGPLEQTLKQMVHNLGLQDCVVMLGPQTHSEIIEEVSSASVFVAPCIVGQDGNRDGLPTVLLEAMALGTPCISTDVTGIPEVIRHEITGLLVDQGDAGSLAAAILRLKQEYSLAAELSRNGRAVIEQDFDVNRNSASLLALYNRAVLSQADKQR